MLFLAHPLRLTPQGIMATVDDSTDEFLGQAIHIIEATRQGERPMAPAFGVPDPIWGTVRETDVQAVVDLYGPAGVQIDSVEVTQNTPVQADAAVTWSRTDGNQ